ncbi:1-acyl-sn-glycerol-3-phosphate acyltransferase [Undibacterium sp. GrIS 1.8]|uniref:lysophospholipid acyltransferase family protein n=1 Tax=Undibacterium sp. GrIS 1.8 TaxID=3143934 RepID=UPI003398FD34
MIAWRFIRIIVHLFAGMLTCAVIFPWTSTATHEALIRRWSKNLLTICKVRVRLIDRAADSLSAHASSNVLVVSNHVSWLDIFVLNTLQPCHFVAKSDIRKWPLVGWLCEKAGTIFLARGKQREVRRIYEGLVHQIEAGKRIAFFPEGTTAAQGAILPFHANLFEAAIEARVPVQPFAIRYVDAQGALHTAADFIGEMTFVESMRLILQGGGMTADLIRLPVISTENAHRREVAQAAWVSVGEGLGS